MIRNDIESALSDCRLERFINSDDDAKSLRDHIIRP